jgi:hypothetical protein
MRFTTSLLESDAEITQLILKGLLSDVQKYMSKVSKKLEPEIKSIVKEGFMSSSEYRSLLSGALKYEFGISDSAGKVSQILQVWDSATVSVKPAKIRGSQIYANLQISMINSSYNDVLALQAASVQTKKGQSLPWLEWLLLLGDKTIIKDYEIFVGSNPRSRTGGAVMKKVVGGKWKVPSEFSGSSKNNWVTRVLDSVSTKIDNALKKAVKL